MRKFYIWLAVAIGSIGLYAQQVMPPAGAQDQRKLVEVIDVETDVPASNGGQPVEDQDMPGKKSEVDTSVQEISVQQSAEVPPTVPTPSQTKSEEMPSAPKNAQIKQAVKTDVAGQPLQPAPELEFNVERKRAQVVELVNKAVKALQEQPIDAACRMFTHTKEYIYGDIYVFVYDLKGVQLANGEDPSGLWQNRINLVDWVGTPIIKEIIKRARAGGGWVTYGWHNTTKVSYVQLVTKNGTSYVVGAGYYPQSKEEAVVNLVKGGVALFNDIKKAGQPADWAFSRLSYPSGRFVAGNLYLYALDFSGNIVAQGDRPGLINTNSWDYRDDNGKYVNREIVKKLEPAAEGIWIDYVSKRALKRAYAEKVVDRDGKKYFIACGYYPDADRDQVEELVRKGYQFMKTSGKTSAVEEFSHRLSDRFRYGDLFLAVYDMQGKVVTHGGNADAIGLKLWDSRDEDGVLYIQQMIKSATKEGSWTNAKIKGSFESTYAQKIDLGLESFVISCSYYPVSKSETLMLLVQSAASFLRDNPRETAFASFVKPDGNFRRGDLQIFVFDDSGLCYTYGDDTNLIWRNLINLTDEDGRPFIKLFINRAEKGADFVQIKLNHATKVNYVVPVKKGDKSYVVGSGYYL